MEKFDSSGLVKDIRRIDVSFPKIYLEFRTSAKIWLLLSDSSKTKRLTFRPREMLSHGKNT